MILKSHLIKDQSMRFVGDLASVSVVAGTLLSMLPEIAAVLTIVWTALRIYEMDTVQRLLGRDPKEKEEDE